MSSTFTFSLAVPDVDEDPARTVVLYESSDGATGWVQVDSSSLDLLTETAGVYTWVSNLADPTNFAALVPKTEAGVEGSVESSQILAPVPADPTSFTLYAYAIDFGLNKVAGEKLTVTSRIGSGVASSALVVKEAVAHTDANGYVSIQVPADSGTIDVDFGPFNRVQIDTTGLGGTAADLRGYV